MGLGQGSFDGDVAAAGAAVEARGSTAEDGVAVDDAASDVG